MSQVETAPARPRKRILTGDRPTGALHIGHYVGSLANRVQLQHEYETFILIADVQALTTNFHAPENLRQDILQVALDYLAIGIDPEVATIFVQSMVPEIAELTAFYSMFVPVAWVEKNPTIKTEARQRGWEDDMFMGFMAYPVSQAADITVVRAHLVPVGEDQLPHVELTRRIVRKFNQLYGEVFPEPEALIGQVPRLVGLDGQEKMSKSLGNDVLISDPAEVVATKIKRRAVTDPARIHPKDPGHPEICTVYRYHTIFNPAGQEQVRQNCRNGTIGCVACKMDLAGHVNGLLEPMRERRRRYEERPNDVWEILREGTRRARAVAADTMARVRAAMHIDYPGQGTGP